MKKERSTVEDWFNSAINCFGSRRYKQALVAHQQVKRLAPGGLHDLILTGLQQVAANHFEEALDTYGEALRLDPAAAFVHTQKGTALMYLGRGPEALAAYDEALRLEPGNPLATTQRATVLLLLERYEEALAVSEQAEASTTHSMNPLYTLMNKAGALSGLERYAEALEVGRQMIRLAPRQVVGYAAVGDVLEQLGRDNEALSSYEQGLRRDTRQAGLWAHMAGVLLRQGYSEDALFAFEQAERLGYQEASCYLGKGDALMECRRYRQAVEAYEQALRLEPGDQESQQMRMEALEQALREQAGSEAARPQHSGSAIGILQARFLRKLPDIGARLRSLGWIGAIVAVLGITLVLTFHLDVRPLFKPLLSVALLPLEVLAILLYPLSCALGWGRRRRTGFHPRIVRGARVGRPPRPSVLGGYAWQQPGVAPIWPRLLRANLFGVGYIIVATSAISVCSFYGPTAAVPDPLTLAIFLGGNLLVALHCLVVACVGLLYLGEPLFRSVASTLKGGSRRRGSRAAAWQHQQSEWAASADVERLLAEGKAQAAFAWVNETLAQHPASAALRLAKAHLLEHLARPHAALVCLDEALEVTATARPFSPQEEMRYEAHARKAQLLWQLQRREEALAACEEALTRFGRDPLLYSYKGLLHFAAGDWAAALSSFENAHQYAGHGAASPVPLAFHLMNQGNALCALGRFQEAAHVFTLAKRQKDLAPPLRSALFYNLACTQALLGGGEQALVFLDEVDAGDGESSRVNCARAEVLAALGREQGALAAYQLAAPTASGIDRAETRRALLCRLSCPLSFYEGLSEDAGAFRWRVGRPEPLQLQSRAESAPPSA